MRLLMWSTAVAATIAVALLVSGAEEPAFTVESSYAVVEPECEITDDRLTAISGMAVRSGHTWVINDRGAVLYRLSGRCAVTDRVSLRTQLRERDVTLRDIESLVAGPDGWLWLADTGGNNEPRDEVQLVGWRDEETDIQVATLRYPEGAHDVEAVMMAYDRKVVLVAKTSDESASVFESDEPVRDDVTLELRRRGSIALEKPEGSASGARLVTGAAVSPQGVFAVLRTYTNAWEYDAFDLDLAGALLTGEPRLIPLPSSPQGEAITYSSDGLSLLVTGEGSPVTLDRVQVTRSPVPIE